MLAVFIMMPLLGIEAVRASELQQHVYDRAHLLSKAEIGKLESLSAKLGAKRDTDFIIITTKSTNGEDIADYTGDFYDRYGKGSTAILTIDMTNREVFIAGFKKPNSIWTTAGSIASEIRFHLIYPMKIILKLLRHIFSFPIKIWA